MSGPRRIQARIAPDHPALPGHFPGRPIVPGVVLLDAVAASVREHFARGVSGFPSVKFLAPLLPGEDFEIVLEVPANHLLRFRCESAGRLLLQGSLNLAPPP